MAAARTQLPGATAATATASTAISSQPHSADRAARGIGQIDRDVVLWTELCRRLGLRCVCEAPQRRAKWSAGELAAVTGWTARTSEHGRDAARLAWEWAQTTRARSRGGEVPSCASGATVATLRT